MVGPMHRSIEHGMGRTTRSRLPGAGQPRSQRRLFQANVFEKRTNGATRLVAMLAVAISASAASHPSEQPAETRREAYSLTLQIVSGIASCTDEFSGPEYYATAYRRDPVVEDELAAIGGELDRLSERIKALSELMEPLERREGDTVPLSDAERQELASLRTRGGELAWKLREDGKRMSSDERRALDREISDVAASVQRLMDSIPLTGEEARLLRGQREERGALVDRRSVLNARRRELTVLVSMRTPGSLRVYPNDSLRLRLMEDDALSDDTCATWNLVLDRESLNQGGLDLERTVARSCGFGLDRRLGRTQRHGRNGSSDASRPVRSPSGCQVDERRVAAGPSCNGNGDGDLPVASGAVFFGAKAAAPEPHGSR